MTAVELGSQFEDADYLSLADAVQLDESTGRLYFHRFLDSLHVVDALAQEYM